MTAPPQSTSSTPSPSSFDEVRRLLGDRYTIERELGRGGMGTVYLARDLTLDRPVALKVLPPEFAADPSLRERFLRETRTAASFSHPNIVPVHSVEERTGVLAFAMGFVEGESLAQRVARAGPLTTREIVRVLQDIGYALAYAHGRRVVHRDIKPDNIMIERATGRALLMDFGISRAIATPMAAAGLTRVGEVVGTPEYMSPEQASGDVVDGRSDLYSLGLVAWYAATGETVMTGESTQKILVRQLTEAVPSIGARRVDLPEALGAAIDRCTAKDPSDRFATAEELVDTIDAAQLSAPEVPLHVRLFAQELGVLSLVTMFIVLIGWIFFLRFGRNPENDLDSLVPIVLLFAIGLTRYLQTFGEARRLVSMGFSVTEITAGLHRVLDERDEVRAQLRNDPETRRRRTSTIRAAIVQLVLGIAGLFVVRAMRIQYVPGRYSVPSEAVAILISAVVLVGVGLVLLIKSPFRTPPNDKLYRRIWTGPFGKLFLKMAARGVKVSSSAWSRTGASGSRAVGGASLGSVSPTKKEMALSLAPVARVSPPSVPLSPAPNGDAMAKLERRISALERWREERGPVS